MQLNRECQIYGSLPSKLGRCRQRAISGPIDLIGLPYRIGADPIKHGATDCVNLCRFVLAWHGISTPTPERQWYRRLRAGDSSIFIEQLELWGHQTTTATTTTIALVRVATSYAMAAYFDGGWLHCSTQTSRAVWSPSVNSEVLYCPGKSN